MTKICEKIAQQKLWVAVDETTDSCGQYAVNLIAGLFDDKDSQLIIVDRFWNLLTIPQLQLSFWTVLINSIGLSMKIIQLISDNGKFARFISKIGKGLPTIARSMCG